MSYVEEVEVLYDEEVGLSHVEEEVEILYVEEEEVEISYVEEEEVEISYDEEEVS